MLILALVHAELGGMYPVAGGSARYPHFAFGSLSGFAIGWIVWVGSVTVAPIEVLAVTTYLIQWFPWMNGQPRRHGGPDGAWYRLFRGPHGCIHHHKSPRCGEPCEVQQRDHDMEDRDPLPRRHRADNRGIQSLQLYRPGWLRPVRDHGRS